MRNPWETHYKRDRSALFFPDENLVRLLKKALDASPKNPEFLALDLGCGSGRHLSLCRDLGIPRVIGTDRSLQGLSLFSIIHGTGEGILGKGIHDYLRRQPAVAEYHFARPEEGGYGKTVVRLK